MVLTPVILIGSSRRVVGFRISLATNNKNKNKQRGKIPLLGKHYRECDIRGGIDFLNRVHTETISCTTLNLKHCS